MENQILKQILDELKGIKEIQTQTNKRLDSLEFKVDSVKDQISDLDAKNATYHLETSSQLNSLLEDVDYLTHKEHQTEKEVYTLRKKIEVIK